MVFPLIPIIAGAAGAAASGIGSMIQGQEAAANEEAAIRARNQAVQRELRRQGKFTRQAADVFTDSLDIFKRISNGARLLFALGTIVAVMS